MTRIGLDRRLVAALRDDPEAPALWPWFDSIRKRLHRESLLLFALSELELDEQRSCQVAIAIAGGIGRSLQSTGGPEGIRVEVSETQRTYVPAGHATRTLLPHNDGGHGSYLTPSRLDAEDWPVEARRYAEKGHCEYSTLTHKVYAGIFVRHAGEALSVTTFYPLVPILARGYRARHSRSAGSIAELAQYLGRNLLQSLARRAAHASAYPSLAGMLGCSRPVFEQIAPHTAEGDLPPEAYEGFPELPELVRSCPCRTCSGPAGRLFCHSLVASLGLTWPAFRREFERRKRTRVFDFLFWNNLRVLHGGLRGGPSRLLQPISLVVDRPAGASYEAWLARCWRGAEVPNGLRDRIDSVPTRHSATDDPA